MSNQKPRTIDEQIRLLRSRGMAFSNEEEAKQCLAHISYFRLKYYWTDMRDEETEHDFKENASFDEVIARYNFDRNLRLILFDAIEIIEVALSLLPKSIYLSTLIGIGSQWRGTILMHG